MGQITDIDFKDRDHFYVLDNRAVIKEFDGFKSLGKRGIKGEGPCEHGRLMAFAAQGDSLYMLDGRQGKFIVQAMDSSASQACREILDENLPRFTGLQVIDGISYFIQGTLTQSLSAKTNILYKLDSNTNAIDSTSVQLNDLNISLLKMPLRISMASDKRDENLYFYLPLTQKVFRYNTRNKKLDSIPVDVYIAKDQNIFEEQDIDKFMNILSNEIEIIFDLFALEKGIAVGYKRGTEEDLVWGVKIFDNKGRRLGAKEFDDRLVYMNNDTMMLLHLNSDNQENPYSFKVYEYSFE